MRYEVKELGVGGILDQAISLVKNRFGLLFGISLCLYVPFGVVTSLMLLALQPELQQNATVEETAAFTKEVYGNLRFVIPIVMIQMVVVIPLTSAAVIHAVANEYLERPTTVGASIRTALRVLVPLVWTSFLMYIIIYLGLLACIIPGIYFSFRYALCSNIVVIERISGVAALRRSRDLMLSNRTRHYNTAFLLFLLLVVIQFGVTSVANLIPEDHLSMVVAILLQAVNVMFGTAAVVVFYFSCRCKADNWDLVRLAEAVGVESPEPPDAGVAQN